MLASTTRSAGIIAASLTLIGCAVNPEESTASSTLPTGSWTLAAIDNQPLADPLPPGLRPVTLTIDDAGAVSGSAGINQYSGSVETAPWANREIAFGPLAVSRMAGPPAAMSIESTYLSTLDGVRTFEVAGGTLTLRGVAGELLVYQRAE